MFFKFLNKKTWRNALALKGTKAQVIFKETLILASLSSAVFRLQNRISVSFNLFCSGDKRLYQSSSGNEVDFRDIMNVSPSIGEKLKFHET